MKIRVDSDIKLAGIGLVPWTRLGPQQWLDDYAIASMYGWDMHDEPGMPRVYALSDEKARLPKLPKLNTQALLRTKEFQQLLDDKLPGYDILTYKPVRIPEPLVGRKFLMVDPEFTERFENKVWFRERFAGTLNFPAFKVYARTSLSQTPEAFQELMAGRERIVIQDEALTGGKGTFIVGDFGRYRWALKELEELSKHGNVVISDIIEGAAERSIQGCVTRYGVVTGPLQRQIVAHPLLANLQVASGDKFCGAEIIDDDQNTPVHKEAQAVAQIVGEALKNAGYRGIFGVDFLLDEKGELFVLEVNPRITGVTPLLTALDEQGKGVPFYLLHLLELGGYPYEIQDASSDLQTGGSLLVLHSLENVPVYLKSAPQSGTYALKDGEAAFIRKDIRLRPLAENEFIIQQYMPPGMPIKPGGRLVTMQFGRKVIDGNSNSLYNHILTVIEKIQKQIITKPV